MGIIPITMFGIILLYQFHKKTPHAVVNQFCKKFYGQKTSSHHGKYKYHRKGLLDTISHQRLIRQVVIIKQEDVPLVTTFLHQYPLEFHLRQIILTDEDRQVLRVPRKKAPKDKE